MLSGLLAVNEYGAWMPALVNVARTHFQQRTWLLPGHHGSDAQKRVGPGRERVGEDRRLRKAASP